MRLLGLAAISLILVSASPVRTHAQITTSLNFSVNMAKYQQAGMFNPDSDIVVVRGGFMQSVNPLYTNWEGNQLTLSLSGGNDSIYSVSAQLSNVNAGDVIQYKFVIVDTSKGQSSVTDWTSSAGTWESFVGPNWADGNRVDTLTSATAQSIPVVYFNNASGTGATHKVTFQVDMTRLFSAGFDSSSDTIGVRGSIAPLSWGVTTPLSRETSDKNIYSTTIDFSYLIGSQVQYKFIAGPGALFIDAGWDTLTNNRVFIFPDQDTVLAAVDPAIWFISETPLSVEATDFKAVAAAG